MLMNYSMDWAPGYEIFVDTDFRGYESRVCAWIVLVFSLIVFITTAPLFYVQFTNLIRNTTTHQRYAFNRNEGKRKSLMINSDTSSMLLVDDSMNIARVSSSSHSEIIRTMKLQHRRKLCLCPGSAPKFNESIDLEESKDSEMNVTTLS